MNAPKQGTEKGAESAPGKDLKQGLKRSIWSDIEAPRAPATVNAPATRPDKPLTARERRLLRILVDRDGEVTRTAAAIEAGYPKRSASSQVSKLLNANQSPHFVRALREARAELDEMYAADRRRHLRKLAELRDDAAKKGQLAAAINAEYRRGQAAEEPIYVDRKEVRTGSLDQMSLEDVRKELERLKAEYGLTGVLIDGESSRVEVPGGETEEVEWLDADDGGWLDTEE